MNIYRQMCRKTVIHIESVIRLLVDTLLNAHPCLHFGRIFGVAASPEKPCSHCVSRPIAQTGIALRLSTQKPNFHFKLLFITTTTTTSMYLELYGDDNSSKRVDKNHLGTRIDGTALWVDLIVPISCHF